MKTTIVVTLPNQETVQTLKSILPTYLSIDILESQVEENIVYLSFDNTQKLPDFSELNNPKYAIEYYLENHDFPYLDEVKETLPKIDKALANIQETFLDAILKDTAYLDTENLFYMQPLSTWSKKEVNKVFSTMKKIKNSFSILDDFLNIELLGNTDELYTNMLYNMECEFKCNNFKGFSCDVSEVERKFKAIKKIIAEIKQVF